LLLLLFLCLLLLLWLLVGVGERVRSRWAVGVGRRCRRRRHRRSFLDVYLPWRHHLPFSVVVIGHAALLCVGLPLRRAAED
jgi:hypothetical protein